MWGLLTLDRAAKYRKEGETHIDFENRYIRKDGQVVNLLWSARWSEADRVRIAVARDVTALKRAESVRGALYLISEAANVADSLPALCREIHRVLRSVRDGSQARAATVNIWQCSTWIWMVSRESMTLWVTKWVIGCCSRWSAGSFSAFVHRTRSPVWA